MSSRDVRALPDASLWLVMGVTLEETDTMKAIWNDQVVAESDDTVVVEGNHYFPRAAIDDELLTASETTTFCPWKGTAHYYDLAVAGETNPDAVWYYPDPKPAAARIEGRVAFWHGVEVTR